MRLEIEESQFAVFFQDDLTHRSHAGVELAPIGQALKRKRARVARAGYKALTRSDKALRRADLRDRLAGVEGMPMHTPARGWIDPPPPF